LLQEFNIEIRDKKNSNNIVADHLFRLVAETSMNRLLLNESFHDEQLLVVSQLPWYIDIVSYIVSGQFPKNWTK
jgi:hypothetical protein